MDATWLTGRTEGLPAQASPPAAIALRFGDTEVWMYSFEMMSLFLLQSYIV